MVTLSPKLSELAGQVSEEFITIVKEDDSTVEFDPSIIMIIAEIIMELIAAIQEYCNKDQSVEGATEIIQSPTFFQKLALRLRVRALLREVEKDDNGKVFRKYGNAVTESLLKVGKSTTESDVEELLQEVCL